MTLTLAAKKAVVQEVADAASKAISAVVADYRGLTVNQMTQLRADARKSGVYLRVVRNNLARRAFENTDLSCLNQKLIGPVFIALSYDGPGDAAKLIKAYAKKHDKLEVCALSIGDKLLGAEQLSVVADLPTRDEALAILMMVMKAPVEKFARTLAETNAKLVRTLVAVKDSKAS